MSDRQTWPGGKRHAMSQSDHEKWNSSHYPGTRQPCFKCDEPTGCCEDDSLYAKEDEDCVEPLCEECWEKTQPCDCGEWKCDECRSRTEGEPDYIGVER